jgi:hypothetical protein
MIKGRLEVAVEAVWSESLSGGCLKNWVETGKSLRNGLIRPPWQTQPAEFTNLSDTFPYNLDQGNPGID